jgi:hypothetical protein
MIKLKIISVSVENAKSRDTVYRWLTFLFSFAVIRCQGEFSDVVGCHTALRSFCEIAYTCGSLGRPVLCECVTQFGYPEPEPQNGTTISFLDACIAAEEAREASSANSAGDEL